jgi:hypothetical protein
MLGHVMIGVEAAHIRRRSHGDPAGRGWRGDRGDGDPFVKCRVIVGLVVLACTASRWVSPILRHRTGPGLCHEGRG